METLFLAFVVAILYVAILFFFVKWKDCFVNHLEEIRNKTAEYVTVLFNKLSSLKKSNWMPEAKYGLFYVNKLGTKMRADKFPKAGVLEVSLYRPSETIGNYRGCRGLALKTGDVIEVTIQNFKVTPKMSILERTVSIGRRYFRYQVNDGFEEIENEPGMWFVRLG